MGRRKSIFVLEVVNTYSDRYPRRKAWTDCMAYCSTLERAEEALRRIIADEQQYENSTPRAEWDLYHVGYIISERKLDAYVSQKKQMSDDWVYNIRIRSYTADGTFVCENSTPELAPDYEFYGRRPEDIRFHQGDIVEVYMYGYAELCVVDLLPPSVERVQEMKERVRKKYPEDPEYAEWLGHLDYSDDSYLVHTLGEGDTHEHPLSYMVFPPSKPVSKKYEKLLKDKLKEVYERLQSQTTT